MQLDTSLKISNNSNPNFASFSLDFSQAEEEESGEEQLNLNLNESDEDDDPDSLTGQDLIQRHHLIFKTRLSPRSAYLASHD